MLWYRLTRLFSEAVSIGMVNFLAHGERVSLLSAERQSAAPWSAWQDKGALSKARLSTEARRQGTQSCDTEAGCTPRGRVG